MVKGTRTLTAAKSREENDTGKKKVCAYWLDKKQNRGVMVEGSE